MNHLLNRRKFLGVTATTGLSLSLPHTLFSMPEPTPLAEGKRVGIIGLDTSHSTAFTKELNSPTAGPELDGYRVVAAYPKGSNDIESSVSRVAGYTEEVKKLGVEIVGSIDELLRKVDVVLLETNDGRLHLEQALKVFKAGKRVFIDKPIAASLADTKAIFEAAQKANVPVFSASSLRYMTSAQDIAQGKTVGKVLGADTYSPSPIEKTHPDLFWYGIHGVETLFTVMGPGCKQVSRTHTKDADVVVGIWNDDRIGTFRGIRSGKTGYGGTAYGEKGIAPIGPYEGYKALLVQIVTFFNTGKPPVSAAETLEIFAFMEAAEESKRQGGANVTLESVLRKV
ncbi:Gfo/Idh/MocA family protein [Larkinella sp.]|uniref:Gfo/Idh/MocA family protein n=1 Tax=Larkinella sp. TaxID=2034517 RepID=UPI003BAA1C21